MKKISRCPTIRQCRVIFISKTNNRGNNDSTNFNIRAAGGEDADIQRISLSRAEALIALKWWDVIALAKILENRNHMPASNFQRIMGDIDKPVPKPMALAELDELVGEE